MQIAITGSSGLIGTALGRALEDAGHRVVPVVRTAPAGTQQLSWDPAAGQIDAEGFAGLDAVVHLAGAGIGDKRWSADRKREVLESRTKGTTLLATALAGLDRPPPVLLSGSAIGFYGDRGDEVLTETSHRGDGFLADVTVAWEAAAAPAVEAGIRTCFLRTGIVLSTSGGALGKVLPLFRLGLGGRLGSGRQWWPWISIDDQVGAILHLLTSARSGPVNLTAPNPVTNADFTRELGKALHRPTVLPVPSFGPRLLLGRELADALLFTSQRVLPSALESDGYRFVHTTLADALPVLLTTARATA